MTPLLRMLSIGLLACLLPVAGVGAEPRFVAVDVFLDSPGPVAAWQFELRDRNGVAQVVGIESGESAAYRDAPYYDREAVNSGLADHVIVADYSLAPSGELPSGRFRVATVHLLLSGDANLDVDLVIAAGPDGARQVATLEIETPTRSQE